MGRGRAKAKQTKVARELKYNSGGTDLERLKAELAGAAPAPLSAAPVDATTRTTTTTTSYDPYAPDGTAGR